ncbi:LysR family transcriptional regulator [Thiomicrorhabdus sp. ZW0627]|uniref:LysR family transcriptional regulator n=1 Tax=Thiomicrorhabdus sp. ZW0627 TaxID=3039774 RepID=UPI002436855C|nr:LysR family transcriptional regulator [Thiomicrorhabdus sp. ZW0627]MDG6774008.1 LysR family transcriptional regulator [Thiomicrorhabdus sp. ZW0627]
MGQLEEMQIFIRVVEAGGIGKAAEQLNLAKSAVSRRLSDLESRLSCKLIQRTTRTSSLTEAGKVYYERALKVLESVEDMNSAIRNDEQQLRGTLRVAVPLSFGLAHMTDVFDQFAKQHPELTLQIDLSDREVDMVEEGFDLAFRIGQLKDALIQARKLVPVRLILCASPDYLKEHGVPEVPEDLKEHKILHYTGDKTGVWHLTDSEGYAHPVQASGQIYANNGDFLCKMAVSGHGIVLSPTFIAWKSLHEGELVQVLKEYQLPKMHAYAVYPQNRYLSQKARVFIDFLVEYFGDKAYWDEGLF